MEMLTKQQIYDFVNSQPDDREVNMFHYHFEQKCGCVMVHYAKDVLGYEEPIAGSAFIIDLKNSNNEIFAKDDDFYIQYIIPSEEWINIHTYKDLKEIIKKLK